MNNEWHKRLPDFEAFDRITMEVKPRWKTSGLSGDEWRQHVEVTFWFKGQPVYSFGCSDMRFAILMLGAEWVRAQEPLPESVIKIESITCDQPSCAAAPTNRYFLRELFAKDGSKLDASENCYRYFRQFCDKHARRGDCGLEDSDRNYQKEST